MTFVALLFAFAWRDDFWTEWYQPHKLSNESIQEFVGDCVLSFERWQHQEFRISDWNKMLDRMENSEDDAELFALFSGNAAQLYSTHPFESTNDEVEFQIQRTIVEHLLRPQFRDRYHQFGVWSQCLGFHGYAGRRHCIEWSRVDRERKELRLFFATVKAGNSLENEISCKRVIKVLHVTGCDKLIKELDVNDIERVKRTFNDWDRWIDANKSNLMPGQSSWRFRYCPVLAQFVYQSQRFCAWLTVIPEDPDIMDFQLMPVVGPCFVFQYPAAPFRNWKRGPIRRIAL